jgi:uncharacterized membrane protein
VRDFHAAALAIPLLLTAFWAVESGHRWLAVAAAALTLLCREDAALPVIGLGAWMAVARGRWIAGLLTAGGALVVLVADLRWLIPAYRGEPYSHLWRYRYLGGSIGEILWTGLMHPLRTVGILLTTGRAVYLAALLAPLGVLPGFVENLLSSDPILYHHRTQYQSFVLPFLILGAISGYARLERRQPGRWPAPVLVVAMVASLALASRTVNDLAVARFWPTSDQRAAYRVLAHVPPGAAVSALDPYVPHLSLRRFVFVFPVGIEKSDYVLVDLESYPWRRLPDVTLTRDGARVTITVGPREWRYLVAAQSGPHLLLRRM